MRQRFSLKIFGLVAVLFIVIILLPLCVNHRLPQATETQTVSYDREEFIKEVAPTLTELSETYGVKPSIIIAQAILESNYGQTLLASKYHNLFAVQAQDGEPSIRLSYSLYEDNAWVASTSQFTVYKSWDESIYDYFKKLRTGTLSNGTEVYTSMLADYAYPEIARSLQTMSFRSDPEYAEKLIKIIAEHDLIEYD